MAANPWNEPVETVIKLSFEEFAKHFKDFKSTVPIFLMGEDEKPIGQLIGAHTKPDNNYATGILQIDDTETAIKMFPETLAISMRVKTTYPITSASSMQASIEVRQK